MGRKIGNAVRRNRLKRLIREAFRLEREAFMPQADIIVVAKRGIDPMHMNLADVREDLRITLRRIRRDVLASKATGASQTSRSTGD